jgi:hypothetical protein
MTFDFTKRLKRAMDGRAQNVELENMKLQQSLRTPPAGAPSIIGGQFVAPGDTAGYNAANATRNAVAADANARMSLRGKFGSRDVTSMRGTANSAAGGGNPTEMGDLQPIEVTAQRKSRDLPGGVQPNVDLGYTPANSGLRAATQPFSATVAEQAAGNFLEGPPATVADALNRSGTTFEGASGGESRSGYGIPPTPSAPRTVVNVSAARGNQSLRRMAEGDDTGFMAGGVVDKPRMVKQPGYKCGGKVKMPGYEKGGQLPRLDGFAWDDEEQLRMATGQVGKKSKDNGKDTVDVRVREGEYLLNPETVEGIGGGDYQNGVRILDETVRQTTGQEPGPVPVNEDGEAQRGFAKGGKMGYIAGGTVYVDEAGRAVQYINGRPVINTPNVPAVVPQATVAGPAPAAGGGFRSGFNEALRRAGVRNPDVSLRGIRNFVENSKNLAARGIRGAGRGAQFLGRVAPAANVGFEGVDVLDVMTDDKATGIDKANQVARGVGRTASAAVGANVGMLGGPLAPLTVPLGAAVGYFGSDAIMDYFGGEDPAARSNGVVSQALSNKTPTTETAPAAQTAAERDAARAAAGEYYRPFGGGEVSLRGVPEAAASQAVAPGEMAIVQRTGGPGSEVIVREDIDGVPTFSNLRTMPQAGDAATLQEQANRRVAEDIGIRQMQNQVVQQMRDNAPIYSASGVATEEERIAAERIAAIKNADRASVASLEDMRNELASLGLFTDPETGEVNDAMYFEFIDKVGAGLAAEGIDITQIPAATKMQLMQEYAMALPASNRFNRIVRGETGMNPNAILSPSDVSRSERAGLSDLGWFNDRSDVGLWDIITGADVNEVNIPGADGTMKVTRDDLFGNDLRAINFFEGRGGR